MGWFPGDLRHDGTKYVIDDAALADSMALEMENQLKDLYEKLKGAALPDIGIDERRLLFLAIARGVLKYIADHPFDVKTEDDTHTHTHSHALTGAGDTDTDIDTHQHDHGVTFDITL